MFKKGNNFDRVKQRFSLRKLNIGVCSVLLGLTFMSGNNNTVKAETTQNPTKLEESKATDQSQTGPTHPQRVVDASAAVKNNTNATNSDNGGSDLSEVGLKGINQNNNGTETVNTAEIADQTYANAAYEASLLEVDANSSHDSTQTGESATISQTDGSGSVSSEDRSAAVPSKSNGSSDNNTETNSRSTIIGLNEYSNPKHLGKVTEPLSDTARSIKQVNITPDELKPTLLDETGKAVENTSKVLNFDLSVYVHDTVSDVNNLDLNWQIDDRLSNQIDSISIDEGKGKTPVTFKKDTDSNVWRADFNKAAQMTGVSGGVLNGHVQKTGTITFKDSIFNVLKQADILNKNNEVDTNKDPLVYRSYVSYEGDTPESGFVWGIGTQFAPDAYDPHSIIATTFNTTYFNTDKDNQIMAAEKNYGVSTADLNKDGTHSFVGGYDDVYYDSTNNTIVVDNYLNRWDSKANDNVKSWTYHYGVDPKLLPYIKSGEISRINFRHVADSGASYKSQVRALPNATNDNDPTYNYHNQLLLDQNGDGAFSGQKDTQYQKYASENPSVWNNHGKVSSNLGNYYYGILGSRPLVIRTIYHLKDKLSDGSKMSLTGLLREIGKTTTTPQLLFTNFMTDTEGKVVKGTESVSAPTFNQLFTPIAGPDQITQTVNYVDGKNQTIASQNYVGKKDTTQDFTGQVPQGWVLDGDTLPKTITISTNGPQNIKVKIDPQLVNDLQNNLKNANALHANTDTPKVADGALTQAIADGNNASKLLYGKDAPTNMQNTINELANTNDLVQALINGKNAESTAKYYNDTDDKQKALTNAMTAGTSAISSGITAQDQFEGAASAIETAIKGLSGKETDKKALTDAISKGEAAQKSASYYNDDNDADKSALDNALSKAGEDLNNNALTQAAADQDAKDIETAINGLKGQPTNLDKLNQAISDGTSAQAGSKYANSSSESKGALDQAINAGQTAKTQSGLTQKEADADASAIETAIKGLSGKETDKTALTDAINKGHKTQTDSSDYQDTSDAKRRQLDKDITDAETLNQDPKASQSNVDAAAKKISDDINNLNQGTDASKNKPVIPSTKTPVSDNSHLTDDEKGQVKDNVQESNPAGKVTNVDDQGNTTITYPDGSKNVVSGKDTTTGTSKDNLNKSIDSGNNTKSSGNYNNTSDQNRDDLDKAIKHGQDVVNDPHASQKDIDNATKAINKAIDNVNNGQTDASKNKPVIPSTKTPVSDNSHLTDDEKGQVKDNVQESNPAGKVTNVDDQGNTTITYPDGSKNTISGDQVTTVIITGDDYTYDDYAYNDFYQVIIKANAVQVYTLPKGNLTKEKKLAHGTTLTVLETKKIDGQVWYRIGTNRWIMAATTIKVGELENFKLKRLSKKTKTTATVWVNKLAIYNNVNGKMTKKHLTRGTKVRIYAIATVNGGEWYKIGKNKWIPAAGVHELNDFYQVIIKANAVQVYTLPKGNLTKEKKLAHGTTLTVLETKKIDGQVWYRIGTNRWIMAATTIKVGELENFKLKRLSKKTKTTATVWVNKLAIYNNVNGKMTKKHLTRGTKVRIYAIATVNGGEWYKIGKNKWIPAAGVHELTVEPL